MTSTSIAVVGLGAWGAALAKLLVRNGHFVRLWGSSPGQRARLRRDQSTHWAHPAIKIYDDMDALLHETSRFLIAVPSRSFRATMRELRHARIETIAWATKGLEPNSGKLLSEIIDEVLGPGHSGAVVSGPTFASEVALDLPSALTVASCSETTAATAADWFRNDRMMVQTSRDIIGVQIGGTAKNVIAIAAGISDGLGFGANARAAIITRGLEEIIRLGVAMGARLETFQGVAGIGDLVLTCTNDASRNRRVGLGLGLGERLTDVQAGIGQETEGITAARELRRLAQRFGISMPVVEQVCRVLFEQASPSKAMAQLFRSQPRIEPQTTDMQTLLPRASLAHEHSPRIGIFAD